MLLKKIPVEVAIKWIELLEKNGVERNIAENIVSEIRTHPKLFLGDIDSDTLADVEEVLSETNFEIKNEKELKKEMLNILEKYLCKHFVQYVTYPTKKREGIKEIKGVFHKGISPLPLPIPTLGFDFGAEDRTKDSAILTPSLGFDFGSIEKKRSINITLEKWVIWSAIENHKEAIQNDLKGINLDDIKLVLIKFSSTVLKNFQDILKFALFPGHDETERDLLYKYLIKSKMEKILYKLLVESGKNEEE